jgi:hypothetical protein
MVVVLAKRENAKWLNEDFVKNLLEQTTRFEREYGQGKANAKDYLAVGLESFSNLEEINRKLQLGQTKTIETMQKSGSDPQALQKAHRDCLLSWIDSM